MILLMIMLHNDNDSRDDDIVDDEIVLISRKQWCRGSVMILNQCYLWTHFQIIPVNETETVNGVLFNFTVFDSYDDKDECGRNTWKSAEFETRKYFEKVIHFLFFFRFSQENMICLNNVINILSWSTMAIWRIEITMSTWVAFL